MPSTATASAAGLPSLPPALPARPRRPWLAAGLLWASLVAGVLAGLPAAGFAAQAALIAFGTALIGWTVLGLDDVSVALAACLGLVAGGVLPAEALFQSLGHDLIWLLLGAFVLAAVIARSGLAERLTLALVAGARRTDSLFHRLNLAIGATAFIIPSTSARAALLLPVFLVLARAARSPRQIKALALLFPTSILLTAGASLLGAGAHLVAVQFIEREAGLSLGFIDWAVLALPLALVASVAATSLILALFLDRPARHSVPSLPPPATGRMDRQQGAVLAITAATVGLWFLGPGLGLDPALVALGGALAATRPALTGQGLPAILKQVEWGLLVFLAATLVLARSWSLRVRQLVWSMACSPACPSLPPRSGC